MAELGNMQYITISSLEKRIGSQRAVDFARESEYDFVRRVTEIAYRAAWDPKIKAIFISGPTSSGKTTFTDRLSGALHLYGRTTVVLNMDDYYHPEYEEHDEFGRPDYESMEALDAADMVRDIERLLNGERVELPTYDFVTRSRVYDEQKYLNIPPRGLLLVEGLHGLNKSVIGQLDRDACLGVFIMPWGALIDDTRILNPSQLRMLRRISRDVRHRGATAFSTLDYWPMIAKNESEFVPVYLREADEYINSVLPYEFCVTAPLARRFIASDLALLEQGKLPKSTYTRPDVFYADLDATVKQAQYFLKVAELIPEMPIDVVPEMSILNEFLH